MIEHDFVKIIQEYNEIVESIEKIEIAVEESISKLKSKLRLFDGTILWVREIRTGKELEAYSYYWLRPDETMIIGWDNAPHHKEIESFPHHIHKDNNVEPSKQKTLREVLGFIREFLA